VSSDAAGPAGGVFASDVLPPNYLKKIVKRPAMSHAPAAFASYR